MINTTTSIILIFGTVSFLTEIIADSSQRLRQRKTPVLSASSSSRERKPNIVLILTDDQDVELGSLNFMPNTLKSIRDKGAQCRHAYVTTPMCCPSRSSLLTGMYVHNHQVYTNNDNCSSTQWQATYETRSFATYLSNAGYRTGYFGKYLNKYNGSYVPPGWREWGGLIMNSKYYNYSINMNGKKIKHGFDYHKDYYPDLIANDSIAFLRQSKKNNAHKPVMLTMSFPAPHGPEDSAPQYSHLFFNVTTHHTPSYDHAPNPDKQWILQVTKKMQPIHKQFTDLLMTKRLQTLQSVDSAVKMVVDELEALGELDNTYIIYTSDHGYHLGQFGLIKGKSFPFEFDVRVPFLVRGPGVEQGTEVHDIVLNIDLAPTFLDIAGVEAPPHMDGRSVLPLFLNSKRNKRMKWPDTFLIESSGRRETPYLDAKLKANKQLRRNITTESPFSTSDVASSAWPTETTTTLRPRPVPKVYESGEVLDSGDEDDDFDGDDDGDDELELDGLFNDAANATNRNALRDNELLLEVPQGNKLERLASECARSDMKLPCRSSQKWYCENEHGRWRRRKCKSLIRVSAASSSKLYRKCACFTESGLVYTRMLRNVTRRHTRPDRIKRNAVISDLLFRRINVPSMSSRAKRDTLEHVESAIRDVEVQIKGLNNENASDEDHPNLDTNTIPETSAGCVMYEGKVNCSMNVYNNRKTWRQSRHQIDNEIQQVKQHLDKLKKIRKHLKNTKPIVEEDSESQNRTMETTEINELANENASIENTTKYNKRRRKRPHDSVNLQTTNKRPRLETESPEGNRIEVSTANPFSAHANPHRHHNHKFTFLDPDTSTEGTKIRKKITTAAPRQEETIPYPNAKYHNNYCDCEPEEEEKPDEREQIKDARRKLKEEKLRRKLRKQRKKDQLEKECGSERMNCFHHDNDHWKTAPVWTEGPFCFCMNANNNTYSCVRTINATHNFLYCEFTTGFVTFYDLRKDPYELYNLINTLRPENRSYLHDQLRHLIACKGRACTVSHNAHHHVVSKARSAGLHHAHPASTLYNRSKKRRPMDDFHGRGTGSTPGVRINMKERSRDGMDMAISREAGIRRKRRKTSIVPKRLSD